MSNFSSLRSLYRGSEVQFLKLLRAVAEQFEDIEEGCKKACLSVDIESFNRLKHQAQAFLRLTHHTLLLNELDQAHKLLQSNRSCDGSSLQVLFSELQGAISLEIKNIEERTKNVSIDTIHKK